MKPQDFQHGEIRDADDNIISAGTYGKKTAFVNSTNDGILDYIINNFECLNDKIDGSGTGGTITIDDALSTTSTNAVTNKAITTGINSVSTALSDFEDVVIDTYAKTADVYTKTEVDSRVSAIPKFSIDVVDTLPTSGSSETVYLVKTGETSPDLYTEYIYVNGSWEKLGTQTTDLTDYVKNEELANVAKTGSYSDLTNTPTIPDTSALQYCVNGIIANSDGGSFTYECVNETGGKITTNNVYQRNWTSYSDICPVALAPYGGQNGSIAYTTKVKIRPDTGAITCGTINGIDITKLAKSSDIPTKNTTTITLASTSWSDSKYTISDSSITADSIIFFDVPVGTTAENFNAIQKAKIVAASQRMETLVLQAMGTVPTIDTEITLVVID